MFVKRGQISTEYLIVVGFVVFLVMSTMGIALFYSSSAQDRLKSFQLDSFARKIITDAEAVFYAGAPSKATIQAYMPEGVHDVRIQDNYLILDISSSTGVNTVSFESKVPISFGGCPLTESEGLKKIIIEAESNGVTINEYEC